MTIHHIYNDDGSFTVWRGATVDADLAIVATDKVVQVYAAGVPVLRFTSEDAPRSARILANLIFQTDKEYAS